MINIFSWFFIKKYREDQNGLYFSNKLFTKKLNLIPKEVYLDWKINSVKEFPGIETNYRNWIKSVEGLFIYFKICSYSKEPTVLVSVAADSVWHSWLKVDKYNLEKFQKEFFDKKIEHLTKDEMFKNKINTNQAIINTWNCSQEIELSKGFDSMPLLFTLDKKININNGWLYEFDYLGENFKNLRKEVKLKKINSNEKIKIDFTKEKLFKNKVNFLNKENKKNNDYYSNDSVYSYANNDTVFNMAKNNNSDTESKSCHSVAETTSSYESSDSSSSCSCGGGD